MERESEYDSACYSEVVGAGMEEAACSINSRQASLVKCEVACTHQPQPRTAAARFPIRRPNLASTHKLATRARRHLAKHYMYILTILARNARV